MSKLEHDWSVRQNLGVSSERNLKQSWKSMVGQVSPIAIGISKSWSMTCGVEKTNLGMVWPCEHSLGK